MSKRTTVERLRMTAPPLRSKAAGLLVCCAALALSAPCFATFHFMQIEKIVGGVNGDTSAQAIQLRMREAGQNQVYRGKLIAFDAAGANPVVLVDFKNSVPIDAAGSRILATSQAMTAYTDPPVVQNFIMDALIPESYLAAGSIIFENDEETLIVWRASWGGSAYSGETTGALTNDDDREFGPAFGGRLPSDGLQVLEFSADFEAKSTSNAADYQYSDEPGTLTNNSDETFTLIVPDCSDTDGAGPDSDGDGLRDVCDGCPEDPGKTQPGVCGCGRSDLDSDGDGTPDCEDSGQGDGNGNDNSANDNSGSSGNENENANVNSNENDNGNVNENDNVGGSENDNLDDHGPGSGNDNSATGNGNDNGGGSSAPRGCTPGVAAILVVLLGLSELRSITARRRVRFRA